MRSCPSLETSSHRGASGPPAPGGGLPSGLPPHDGYARLGGYQTRREPVYDGFDVSWFGGVDRLRAALGSPAAAAARHAAAAFLGDGEPVGLVTRELSLIA